MHFARREEDGTGTSGDAHGRDEGFLHVISTVARQWRDCTYLQEQRSEGHCVEDAGATDGWREDVRVVVVLVCLGVDEVWKRGACATA